MTLIAIHLLQNHAPSNLNRDDNGDPKDAIFGGVRRARISSQALKRSIRRSGTFHDHFAQAQLLGERTQLLPEWVRSELEHRQVDADVRDAILYHAARFGKADKSQAAADDATDDTKTRGKGGRGKGEKGAEGEAERLKTKQLMFLSAREVSELTDQMLEVCRELGPAAFMALETEKELLNKRLKKLNPHAVDVAMFGRMTTSSPFKDIDAAVQVSHAFSTHRVDQEFDYYTAVDDRSGEVGAGFIGDVAFNSATYYKYINIHWQGLLANLHGERDVAKQAVAALLRAAMTAIPSGKQNTFAAHNLPDFALIEVIQQNIPVSYANAFLRPVRAGEDESLMDRSIAALTAYAGPLPERFDLDVERAVFPAPADLPKADVCGSVSALAEWVAARLPQDPAL
ncbi:MAG TPA: type I-E CRISPR-associated protein Cas7/Cse4/CasC [Kouleothrix sp.]|uniref:type I-E CRISPR-associated protein Cas7/Cse4/CasC n=1 Tax=Kouleothrix sp. TaxID=2779161 RepID=UPI002C7F48B0|nr:type I-E CRISPR-associated protein Cas7/Cse4/CasC [Kouleothrix sp.]